jgi:von Willebrand factor type A domain/Aerotolerance regulator N-terminal
MKFLQPHLLAWALLAAVPVILYFFRHRPRTQRVSTLLFFKSLAKEHQESAWLRKLKRLLSLLLSLAVIAGATAALARLVVSPGDTTVRSVVVLVDRSASMAAKDMAGRSRLAEAVASARRRVGVLAGGVSVAVIAYDARPHVLLPRSLDRRQAIRALDAIDVRPIEGDAEPALRLARQLAALATPAVVWHYTDAPATPPDDASPRDAVRVETTSLALKDPINVGITAFQLRPRPLERGRFDAFVQVHAQAARPVEAELQVRIDGALVDLRRLAFRPAHDAAGADDTSSDNASDRQRLLVPIEAGVGHVLALRLKTDAPDALADDDVVLARVPAPRPVRVLWVNPSPDAFTELALGSIGSDQQIDIYHGTPDAWPPKGSDSSKPDAVIFHDWLPDAWPNDYPVIVINPPRALGPVQAAPVGRGGVPVDRLRVTDEHHPLLFGVASARIRLTQTAVLSAEGPGAGLEPLWVGLSGPVMLAGQVRGQRVVVMGFSPPKSEHLPLMASYPLLMGNAIYWAAQDATAKLADQTVKTGTLVEMDGERLTWSVAQGDGLTERSDPIASRTTELDRVGLWQSDTGIAGGAALLSARETMLPRAKADTDKRFDTAISAFSGDMTAALLWLVLAVLVIESWLFHRHAVY